LTYSTELFLHCDNELNCRFLGVADVALLIFREPHLIVMSGQIVQKIVELNGKSGETWRNYPPMFLRKRFAGLFWRALLHRRSFAPAGPAILPFSLHTLHLIEQPIAQRLRLTGGHHNPDL